MGTLIQLSRRRPTPEEPPSSVRGDSDLVPIAIVLWVGSVLRVVAGAVEGEVMGTEATAALLCVVLIPCWLLWSWVQAELPARDASSSTPPEGMIDGQSAHGTARAAITRRK
jgi:hypothetical protein